MAPAGNAGDEVPHVAIGWLLIDQASELMLEAILFSDVLLESSCGNQMFLY